MAKSGRNLWTKKVSGKTISSGAGRWSTEDLKSVGATRKKNDFRENTQPNLSDSKIGKSEQSSKTDARNSKLRERYREAKFEKIENSIIGKKVRGKVLGIDPSLRGTGLSVIDARDDGTLVYIESVTVRNPPNMTMAECLARIYSETSAMIARNNPVCAAIEQSVYVQNFKTAMILGSSRGAAIAAAACANLSVFEYPPLRIKQAVIGYGRASKQQIAKSIESMVKGAPLLPLDEADASGAALTHIFTHKI